MPVWKLIAVVLLIILGVGLLGIVDHLNADRMRLVDLLVMLGFDHEWAYYSVLSPTEIAQRRSVLSPGIPIPLGGFIDPVPFCEEHLYFLNDNPLTFAVRKANGEYDLLDLQDGHTLRFELSNRPFRVTYHVVQLDYEDFGDNDIRAIAYLLCFLEVKSD